MKKLKNPLVKILDDLKFGEESLLDIVIKEMHDNRKMPLELVAEILEMSVSSLKRRL